MKDNTVYVLEHLLDIIEHAAGSSTDLLELNSDDKHVIDCAYKIIKERTK